MILKPENNSFGAGRKPLTSDGSWSKTIGNLNEKFLYEISIISRACGTHERVLGSLPDVGWNARRVFFVYRGRSPDTA
jgi:hypothetical protein